MKCASQITGLPIVSLEGGNKFASVRDVLFDETSNRMLAVLTETGGLFSPLKAIRFGDIKSIGEDALVVQSQAAEVEAESDAALAGAIKKSIPVKGKTVMTEDGKDLGRVTDLEIDEASGQVTGYRTSGGIFADLYKGQAVVPAPMALKVGDDVVFVPNSTVGIMEQQAGGLKAAGQNALRSAQEKTGALKEQAAEKMSKTKEAATSDNTKASLEEMKAKAGDVFSQLKDKAGDLKSQAEQKIEDTRIQKALGRPVGRVILDRNDQVILAAGELITNEAIAKARSAGALDMLLSSAVTKKPAVPAEDLRVRSR